MEKQRNWKQIVFLCITLIVLMLSYATNFARIGYPSYTRFDRPDELNVITRLNKAQSEGIFSYGGLTGITNYYPDPAEDTLIEFSDDYDGRINLHFEYHFKGMPIPGDRFVAYKTQTGGQALMYSLMQKVSPFNSVANYRIFRLINAFLIAFCFVLFLGWVYRNFGATTAIVTSILIFITPIFTTVSLSLWWCLWSYYIPFLAMLLLLEKRNTYPNAVSDTKVLVFLAIALFVKCIFTGFEFITTIFIASVCPIVYYCIKEKRTFNYSFRFLIKASFAATLGILAEMMILILQIKAYMGTFGDGINHIVFSFIKRSTFKPDEIVYSLGDVLKMYFLDYAPFAWDGFPISILNFSIFILGVFILGIFIYWKSKSSGTDSLNKPLLVTTAFSMLAALSWLIIFKQHAALHIFIDPIVWYVPFMLFAYVIIGYAISLMIKRKV